MLFTAQSVFYAIFVFWLIAMLLACILIGASFTLNLPRAIIQKTSAYECGFQPFSERQIAYDVHYYRIAVLFLIFDLEIILLIPWVILPIASLLNFVVITALLFVLILGFVYEWKIGVLNWV
jgi:NADH:ubiquinone oxidoreductase subunit 3 (subunit A)